MSIAQQVHGIPIPRVVTCTKKNNLLIVYFNARSLIPKLDELCAIVETHNPDVVSIVESWLCADIPDNEISIPGYHVFRKDRHRHGGGVLLYIKDMFVVRELATDNCNGLEILPIEISFLKFSFCITVFYRPPDSQGFIFDTLCNFLASLRLYQFSHFVLIGDFNVNMNNHDHPLFSKVCNIMDLFNLTQVVTDCTHTSLNGNSSLIDLALVSSPPQSMSCTTIPPLANSDHDGLRLTVSHKGGTQRSNTKKRTVWRYAHADFSKANHLISQTDWDSLYCEDIDQHSTQWQDMYMSIMEQCIPTKVLPPKRRNRPWINKSISQCIRRKNAAFKRAKNTNSPRIWMQYKHFRNRVTSQLRQAKKKFFNNLNLSNPKCFWKSIKALDGRDTSVGTLNHNGNSCATDEQKANALNDYFTSCFNGSSPPVTTTTPDVNNECPSDILCTEEEIRTMLQSLDTSKANGLDGISARMLKSTAYSIAPSITKLFNHSIACGKPPSNWKKICNSAHPQSVKG